MNLTEKYQAVREAVIAAVPEIMGIQKGAGTPWMITGYYGARAVQLADVLRAIGVKKIANDSTYSYYVKTDGYFASPYYDDETLYERWNLEHPLDKQPSAVIDFLHSILCKSV